MASTGRNITAVALAAMLAFVAACERPAPDAPTDPPTRNHAMSDDDQSTLPPEALDASLQTDPEYVIGLPVLVALTVEARKDGPGADYVKNPSIFSLKGRIGLELRNDAGDRIHAFEPNVVVDLDHEPNDTALDPGQTRRFLIDLSPILPDDLEPGTYDLTVSYIAPLESTSAEAAAITFREPDDDESTYVAMRTPEVTRFGSWGQWTLTDQRVAPIPGDPPMQARLHEAVRRAIRTDENAPSDPALLATITGVAQPEAEIIRAEITDDADALTAAAGAHPALTWLVNAVRADAGPVANARHGR